MKNPARYPAGGALLLLTALLVAGALAACGGSDTKATGSAAPTPVASTAQWEYVVLGDSAFAAPDDATTVAHAQARLIKRDFGVDAKVYWAYYPGTTSARVLDELRYDKSLREAIRSAEVVLFDVPVGQMKQVIPFDYKAYRPLPGTPKRYRKGMARMLVDYRRDARAIVEEIVSLRSPDEASIRAIDFWQVGYSGFRDMGLGAVMRAAWLRMNRAVDEACAAQGVPVVDAYTAFMGRDGTRDPVAAGDILPDQMHLTDKASPNSRSCSTRQATLRSRSRRRPSRGLRRLRDDRRQPGG
jgi:hypothetical protein